jgi:3',5'-cyclic AMP phosphodiesterase CpdA
MGAEAAADSLHQVMVIGLWVSAFVLSAAVAVYVWRRLGGLALMGAMLTDYGRVARLGGRPVVWLDHTPENSLKIAHLSDLHITEGARVRLVEKRKPGGNVELPALLSTPQVAACDLLMFTGDITDRGTSRSWRSFLDALAERGLSDKAVLVPGNHDLSLVDVLGDGLRDSGRRRTVFRADRFGIVQLANLLKFAEAFAETGGGRHGFVLSDDGKNLVPYEDAWVAAERAVRPFVAALPSRPVPQLRLRKGYLESRKAVLAYEAEIEAARQTMLRLFPIAVKVPGRDAVLYVLNSCTAISRHPATNALGHVGGAQYRRLEKLSRFFAQSIKLLTLHHHVVRRGEERSRSWLSRLMAKFTVLGDARPLVRFCRSQGVRAVLNGHRHLSYQLRLPNGTVLLAAPSSTLGDELADDPRPQFPYYEVSSAPAEPTVGIHRTVVRLAPTSPLP